MSFRKSECPRVTYDVSSNNRIVNTAKLNISSDNSDKLDHILLNPPPKSVTVAKIIRNLATKKTRDAENYERPLPNRAEDTVSIDIKRYNYLLNIEKYYNKYTESIAIKGHQ